MAERPPPLDNQTKVAYMNATFRGQFYPKNEFEHAKDLIDSEIPDENDILNGMKHSRIVDGHIQTSNIGNDELMAAIQLDSPFLHSGLEIARRNKGLIQPFRIMFFSWRDSLLLTKAKNGLENAAQHATGAKQTPQPFGNSGGFGAGLPQYAPEDPKKPSILERLGLKKK